MGWVAFVAEKESLEKLILYDLNNEHRGLSFWSEHARGAELVKIGGRCEFVFVL
jgi:hypothetical protein